MKYIAENGIIDLTYVQEQLEMKKRAEILKNHQYSIWHSEKEDVWYTYLPDASKADNRRKVKRKKKTDIEKAVCEFYLSLKDEDENIDREENLQAAAKSLVLRKYFSQMKK